MRTRCEIISPEEKHHRERNVDYDARNEYAMGKEKQQQQRAGYCDGTDDPRVPLERSYSEKDSPGENESHRCTFPQERDEEWVSHLRSPYSGGRMRQPMKDQSEPE
jgi:hypothetical protein